MRGAGWISLRVLLWGVCVLVPVHTSSQQQAGGLNLSLDYSERLEITDDESTDEERLTSTLDLSLRSVTRRQSLSLGLGANLEKSLDGGETDVTNPRVSLSYGLQNRNTALQVNGLYRQADISRLTEIEILGETALVLADGDREDTRLGAQLEFGRAAPFGGTFSLSRRETRYSGLGTAGLLDSVTSTANLALRFRIDPRITARVIFGLNDLDRIGGQDVRNTRIGVGASLGISRTLQGEVEAGISRIETTTSDGVASNSSGEYYSLALVKSLPNGTLRGSLNSSFSETGRRTTLRLDRQLARKRDKLRFGVGVSKEGDAGGDLEPLYELGYSRPLPRGGFSASLEQAFGTGNAGGERLDTRLRLALQQNLNPLSSISASFNFRDSSPPGDFGDQQQISLGVDYSRVLTEDWSLVAGYSHIRRDQASGATNRDNRIYLGISLRQAWRP